MKTKCLLGNLAIIVVLSVTGCDNDKDPGPGNNANDGTIVTGWDAQNEPSIANVPAYIGSINSQVPSSFSLEEYLPPVGDQGQYGTCVAWATGYAMKSTLNAVSAEWGTGNFDDNRYLASAKDLHYAIDDDLKGGCNGTNFDFAFKVLAVRGVATQDLVPYTDMLNNCSKNSVEDSWTSQANLNTISNYRRVTPTIEDIKNAVSYQKSPIVIGAKLSDSFVDYESGILNRNTAYDRVGIHAYHALLIVGYDDGRHAVRVMNSWGTGWGENGFCWIDYDFLLREFIFDQHIYIAINGLVYDPAGTNPEPGPNPNPNPNPGPNPNPNPDPSRPDFSARINYDVYSGYWTYDDDGTITSFIRNVSLTFDKRGYSGPVEFRYGLVDATDANNIVFYSLQDNTSAYSGANYYYFQTNVINGTWYPFVFIDPNGKIQESDEDNNVVLGSPIYFTNGGALRDTTAAKPTTLAWNAYTDAEKTMAILNAEKRSRVRKETSVLK